MAEDDEIRAYAVREFQKFLLQTDCYDLPMLKEAIHKMREVGKRRGMSEYELATIYDAEMLLSLYREAMQ